MAQHCFATTRKGKASVRDVSKATEKLSHERQWQSVEQQSKGIVMIYHEKLWRRQEKRRLEKAMICMKRIAKVK